VTTSDSPGVSAAGLLEPNLLSRRWFSCTRSDSATAAIEREEKLYGEKKYEENCRVGNNAI